MKHKYKVLGYSAGYMDSTDVPGILAGRRNEDVVFVEDVLGSPEGNVFDVARIDYESARIAQRRRVYLSHRCVDQGIPFTFVQRGHSVWVLPKEE